MRLCLLWKKDTTNYIFSDMHMEDLTMEEYEELRIRVVRFDAEDIITASDDWGQELG